MALLHTIFKRRSQASDTTSPPAALEGLPKLMMEAQDVVFSISTIFPFVLFTDKIIIRRNHVDVVTGIFFSSAISRRMQYSDIREMTISYNPFFATMDFILMGPPDIFIKVKFLPKWPAFQTKRVILGLIECERKKVDLSKYSTNELKPYLEEIGKTKE